MNPFNLGDTLFCLYFVQLRIAKVKRIHSHGNTSTSPDKEAYATIVHGGEIITDGPVTGNAGKTKRQAAPEAGTYRNALPVRKRGNG